MCISVSSRWCLENWQGVSPDRVRKTRLNPSESSAETAYPLREHLNSVQRMVSGGYCEGLFPDTVCWTRLRNASHGFILSKTFTKNALKDPLG